MKKYKVAVKVRYEKIQNNFIDFKRLGHSKDSLNLFMHSLIKQVLRLVIFQVLWDSAWDTQIVKKKKKACGALQQPRRGSNPNVH